MLCFEAHKSKNGGLLRYVESFSALQMWPGVAKEWICYYIAKEFYFVSDSIVTTLCTTGDRSSVICKFEIKANHNCFYSVRFSPGSDIEFFHAIFDFKFLSGDLEEI